MQNIIIALIILAALIYIKKRLFNLFSSGLSSCGCSSGCGGCKGCNSGSNASGNSGSGECLSKDRVNKPEDTSS